MASAPQISVIMASYNHARFVREAISSVLMQRDVSFEFLIEDDGSNDESVRTIAKIKDARVNFVPRSVNLGACTTLNNLIARARGEFIAVINSDDAWSCDDKLSNQVDILRADPSVGACFGQPRIVDAHGASPVTADPRQHVYRQANRSRGGWMRQFFFVGNCFCHPSGMIRKVCYEKVGAYDNRLRQVPDFDMWARLVKHYDIHVSERELVQFRQRPGENTDSATPDNSTRLANEYFLVGASLLDGIDEKLLKDGFGDLLYFPDLPTPAHRDIEQALLYLNPTVATARLFRTIGLQRIFSMLASPQHRGVLRADYGWDDLRFQREMSVHTPFQYGQLNVGAALPAARVPTKRSFPILRYFK